MREKPKAMLSVLREEMRIVKPALPVDFPADRNFRTDKTLDSLDLIEYVARIEKRFQVMIPDKDLSLLVSLGAIGTYLRARMTP